ncbi:uncharacterized protein FTOL_12415 [Fusarium torulosum]|uniref:Uncharacterized protein n=1 Tax=Fusarium torulosum TaxID=33205 RepID=A0AAE8MKU2_9HYPO|nr:uncharacterized protein FTOL_12415 [Fusarium torulosum]
MSQPRPTTSSMDTLSTDPSQLSSIERSPFQSSCGTYSWPLANPVSNSWNDNFTLLEAFGASDFTQVLPLPGLCTPFTNPNTGLYPMNSFPLNQLYGDHHLLPCNPPSTPFMAGVDTTNPSMFSRWHGDTHQLDWNAEMNLGSIGIVSSEHKDETQFSQQRNTSYVATETLPAPSLDIMDPQRMFPDLDKAKHNTPTQESCLQLPDDPFAALFMRQDTLARSSTADSEGPSSTIPDSCQDGIPLYAESNTSRKESTHPSHAEVLVPQSGYPQAPGTPEFRSQGNYESSTPQSCPSPTGEKSNKPREGKTQQTPLKQLMPSLRPENRFEDRSTGPSRCVAEPRPRLHMKRKHTRDVEEDETPTVPETQHKRKSARNLKLLRLEAKHVSISNTTYKWSSRGWVPEYGLERVPTHFIDTEIVDEIQFTLNSGNFQTVWFSRARGNNTEDSQWEGLDGSGIYKISLSEHDIEFVLKDAKEQFSRNTSIIAILIR